MRLEDPVDPVDDVEHGDRRIGGCDAADGACYSMDPVDPGREILMLMLRECVLGGGAARELGHRWFNSDPSPCSVRAYAVRVVA
jgi:hypothetical protein